MTEEVESTTLVVPERRPSGLRAFRHRDYTIFWLGAFASNTGSWLQNLTIPYVLYQLTGSALWVSMVAVAQGLPMVLSSPLGGSIADRFSRRAVLISTQTGLCLVAVVLWVTYWSGVATPVVLLTCLAAGAVLNGINMPSWQSYVSDLVPRDDLLSAITLNSLNFNAARAIGPGIAGLVIAGFGATWAFALNALSFFFVIVALLIIRTKTLRVPARKTSGVLRQFGQAVRYTVKVPGLLVVMIVSVIIGGLGNPVFSFTVVFAGSVYDVGPVALGILNAGFGVGAVLAAPLVSGRGPRNLSTIVRYALIGYGVAVLAFGISNIYQVGVVALIVVGGCFLAVVSSINTALQLIVDDQIKGRVMAIRMMTFTISMPIGAVMQGWLADRIGVQAAVAIAGALMLALGILLASLRGRIRLGRLDDPQVPLSAVE